MSVIFDIFGAQYIRGGGAEASDKYTERERKSIPPAGFDLYFL